jgi:glycosyltransferase involved in cell wall biosynthesis
VRVLAIRPGPVPPSSEPRRNAWTFLSHDFAGHVVGTSWFRSKDEADTYEPAIRAALGNFEYKSLRTAHLPSILRGPITLAFFVFSGIRIALSKKSFDVIVCYGPFTTGFAGLILKVLTRRPLVVEMPGHPFMAFLVNGSLGGRIRAAIAKKLVPFVLNRADTIKLLYPTQLEDIRVHPEVPRRLFHSFTPVGLVSPSQSDEKYILLLGYPWYLKGVDVLIDAFLRIADGFPEYRLLIVGHCDDRRPFEAISRGHPRIEMRRAVDHAVAVELIRNCTAVAIPSRTEALPRVMLEAMAAGKPIVASKVGGIPYALEDGRTGMIVQPGDPASLAEALERILGDGELRQRLGQNALQAARDRFGEEAYVRGYRDLISSALHQAGRTPPSSIVSKA